MFFIAANFSKYNNNGALQKKERPPKGGRSISIKPNKKSISRYPRKF